MGTDLPRSAALSGASVHRIRVRIFIRSPPPIELAWRAICGPVGSLGGALRRCQIVVLVRALSDFISGRGSWDPSSASIGINREAIGPPVCATRLSTQLQRNHGSAKAHSEFACARPERASRRSSALRLGYPPRKLWRKRLWRIRRARNRQAPIRVGRSGCTVVVPAGTAQGRAKAIFGELQRPCRGRLTPLGRACAQAQITVRPPARLSNCADCDGTEGGPAIPKTRAAWLSGVELEV